jgi:hypothetical protein
VIENINDVFISFESIAVKIYKNVSGETYNELKNEFNEYKNEMFISSQISKNEIRDLKNEANAYKNDVFVSSQAFKNEMKNRMDQQELRYTISNNNLKAEVRALNKKIELQNEKIDDLKKKLAAEKKKNVTLVDRIKTLEKYIVKLNNKVALLYDIKRRKIVKRIEENIFPLLHNVITTTWQDKKNVIQKITNSKRIADVFGTGKKPGNNVAHGVVDVTEQALLLESCRKDADWIVLYNIAFDMEINVIQQRLLNATTTAMVVYKK